MRIDGRARAELRPVTLERHYTRNPDGSVLVCFGDTRVLCTATIGDRVPPFLRDSGKGWVTAEYAMLPGSASGGRIARDAAKKGRALEISRLIGRSLRSVMDLAALGEHRRRPTSHHSVSLVSWPRRLVSLGFDRREHRPGRRSTRRVGGR